MHCDMIILNYRNTPVKYNPEIARAGPAGG